MARIRAKRIKVFNGEYLNPATILEAMKGLLEMRRTNKIKRIRFLKAWTQLRRLLEDTPEYQTWKRIVKERAGGACETCGEPGQQCHHLEPVAWNPDRALDPDNGRYLCRRCHKNAPEHKHGKR